MYFIGQKDNHFKILKFKEFCKLFSDYKSQIQCISDLEKRLNSKHSIEIFLGGELEFYLLDRGFLENKINPKLEIERKASDLGLYLKKLIKSEKGESQFEIDIDVTKSAENFINSVNYFREKIKSYAKKKDLQAIFSPKPFKDDYGSSLQIHVNATDDSKLTAEECANILCNYTSTTLDFFLPDKESTSRLDQAYMAPTHIGWGGNNRSCMIRIPSSSPKRAEHRLCGADINPVYPLYAIYASIISGLEKPGSLKQFPRIYGNASDPQYNLIPIKMED